MTALILLSKFRETEIEIWKWIEDAPDYEVSNLGRVRGFRMSKSYGGRTGCKSARRETPRLLRLFPHTAKVPYLTVGLQTPTGEKQFHVHRLVAKAFVANPENKPQVNHVTGVKSDARAAALEWSTHGENHEHATTYGLRSSGEKHWNARLSIEDVITIRVRVARGESQIALAREYNCTAATICSIVKRRSWRHVP